MAEEHTDSTITLGELNIINTVRTLWMEFIMWSRAFVTSVVSGYGDVEAVGLKLYDLPNEFGNLFSIFFGAQAGYRIDQLFTEQILIGLDIIRAQQEGDLEHVDEATRRFDRNTNETSAYLAQINPYWDEKVWNDLFAEFAKAKVFETIAIATGNFEESVHLSDALQYQAMNMADYMANGIINYVKG
ncbi:MAG: hypothetical protein K0Q48_1952 [Bacillota bacterium]|nr:hypothetical protein [Bacillota bacterium]